jgi:hypothetical protein
MMAWFETQATILVHCSQDQVGKDRYRFWDADRTIPRPTSEEFVQAQILLEGNWQEMRFNRNWGQAYDPEKEGTWLKQKASKYFSTDTGRRSFKVRYQVSSIN